MDTLLRYLILSLLQISVLSVPEVQFLTAVDRLNGNYTDFYFCCNTHGRFLQWEYNHQSLTAFRTNDVGEVWLNERADYTYTATLLSSQPIFDNVATMDSVIVISFHKGMNPSNFSVSCISDRHIATVSHQVSTANKTITNRDDVQLKYLVSGRIVSQDYDSHILVCEVPQTPQFISVIEPILSFSRFDSAGQARTIFSEDRNTAEVQGILMARDNFVSVALILVSLNVSESNVSCYDSHHIPEIELVPPKSQTETPKLAVGTLHVTELSWTFKEESTNNATDILATRETNHVKSQIIIPIIIPFIITTIVMVIVVSIVMLCKCR